MMLFGVSILTVFLKDGVISIIECIFLVLLWPMYLWITLMTFQDDKAKELNSISREDLELEEQSLLSISKEQAPQSPSGI
jgi:Ca2+/Na+ antiporter